MGIMLWLIWKGRNGKLFEGSNWGAEKICKYGHEYLREFQNSLAKEETSFAKLTHNWMPPAEHCLKINVDGASSKKGAGIGIIIRNSAGELEAVIIDTLSNCLNAEHAKILALMKAVQIAQEYGITHFVVEGDASNVVNKINSKEEDLSITENIINGIKNMLTQFPSAQVVHVRRKNNEPAHLATKLALDFSNCRIWFMDFPPSIVNAVLNDLK